MSLLPINRHPSRRQLHVFAAAWLAVVGIAGARLEMHHHPLAGSLLGALAAGVPLAGLIRAGVLRRAYIFLSVVTHPVGWAVSWVILTFVYYLVLTPIALVMRLLRHDPLERTFDRSASTYWTPRASPPPPASYFRQN